MGGQDDRRVATSTPTKQVRTAPPAPLPTFRRVRRGWDPAQVASQLEEIERERASLRAALAHSEDVRAEQRDRLDRFEAIENELTRSVRLARQTGEAVVADAQQRADELLAEARREVQALYAAGRARLAEEEQSLDRLRMAAAAEAALLKDVEHHLRTRVSRAAAALVEIVDRPGGLGPFSQATATLIEFAQLLHRAATSDTPVHVRVDVDDDVAVARVTPAEPVGNGHRHGDDAATDAVGQAGQADAGSGHDAVGDQVVVDDHSVDCGPQPDRGADGALAATG